MPRRPNRRLARGLCGACGRERRIAGQYYGKKCKAKRQRDYRQRRAEERAKLVAAGVVEKRRRPSQES